MELKGRQQLFVCVRACLCACELTFVCELREIERQTDRQSESLFPSIHPTMHACANL
jgi:hypothetical protein